MIDNLIVDKLTLDLEVGDCLGLLGKSGAGKTTVLDLASGLLNPTSGTVKYYLKDLQQQTNTPKIAYVTQKPFIIDGTIAQNLTLFSKGNSGDLNSELNNACKQSELFSEGGTLELGSLLTENGSNLSGGQLTRLSIARAMVLDAGILLLDEPTAALDPKTESRVVHNLKNIINRKICIIATHRPKPLEMCNKFILLDGGKGVFLTRDESYRYLSSQS
jgi:ABC-type bacteriocin/lantibiotic exporter with double-glycine peptidase domain